MRGWLLDTNVISELRRPRPDRNVAEFIAAQPGRTLFTTDISFGEIRYGIDQLDDIARRTDLHAWIERTLRPLFADRVLSITEDVVIRWKTMAVRGQRRGHTFSQPDLFIAAIAALEALVVVSRDTSDFAAAGVPVFNPWSSALHVRAGRVALTAPASIDAVADLLNVKYG